eukprot:6226846-Pyramimonas_sp.AAC.1
MDASNAVSHVEKKEFHDGEMEEEFKGAVENTKAAMTAAATSAADYQAKCRTIGTAFKDPAEFATACNQLKDLEKDATKAFRPLTEYVAKLK